MVSSACQPGKLPPNTSIRNAGPGSMTLPHSAASSSLANSACCQAESRCCQAASACWCSAPTPVTAAAARWARCHFTKVIAMPGPQMISANRSEATGGPEPVVLAWQPSASSSRTNTMVLGRPRNLRNLR